MDQLTVYTLKNIAKAAYFDFAKRNKSRVVVRYLPTESAILLHVLRESDALTLRYFAEDIDAVMVEFGTKLDHQMQRKMLSESETIAELTSILLGKSSLEEKPAKRKAA